MDTKTNTFAGWILLGFGVIIVIIGFIVLFTNLNNFKLETSQPIEFEFLKELLVNNTKNTHIAMILNMLGVSLFGFGLGMLTTGHYIKK